MNDEKNGMFSRKADMRRIEHRFLQGVGSESSSPPVIIEGGVRYIAESFSFTEQNTGFINTQSNFFAGGYAEDMPRDEEGRFIDQPEPAPPHELDCIQRMSEAYRELYLERV